MDNKFEERVWYFTWGFNQGHDNCYTRIYGTYESARKEMVRRHGHRWGFQYPDTDSAGVDRFGLEYIP